EWGHRWLDLKRRGNIDIIMDQISVRKGSTWASYKQWFPIPLSEIQKDPNLVQNEGY
ncbi:MAG: RagB/SusD family nutrient uptake outer membrane protein, partial [Chitinophagaceae bacterium]|nr:RagB/SusD family nutrient uptake outer membrane protein [Chitinophagaceae bacterium]